MKNEQIRIRIEPALKRRWQNVAGRLGLTLSSFIMQSVMAALVQCEYEDAVGQVMAPVFPPRPSPKPEAEIEANARYRRMPSERHTQDATLVAVCIVVGALLIVLAILFR
jgi:hypothetical protein